MVFNNYASSQTPKLKTSQGCVLAQPPSLAGGPVGDTNDDTLHKSQRAQTEGEMGQTAH